MEEDNTEVAMLFRIHLFQTTTDKPASTINKRLKNLVYRTLRVRLNDNNSAGLTKLFEFLPLSFNIFITYKKLVSIRINNLFVYTHSLYNFYCNNRFHNSYSFISIISIKLPIPKRALLMQDAIHPIK
nr:MAG TPA: hypothetical protein [Caudoviricetes sp.]